MEHLETIISEKLCKIIELSEEINRELIFKCDINPEQRLQVNVEVIHPLNDLQETIFNIQNYINNK
tara:strand:+ start:485 stop:682 length:198 start_codon:yes stop_codon:yes gene_type:complete